MDCLWSQYPYKGRRRSTLHYSQEIQLFEYDLLHRLAAFRIICTCNTSSELSSELQFMPRGVQYLIFKPPGPIWCEITPDRIKRPSRSKGVPTTIEKFWLYAIEEPIEPLERKLKRKVKAAAQLARDSEPLLYREGIIWCRKKRK